MARKNDSKVIVKNKGPRPSLQPAIGRAVHAFGLRHHLSDEAIRVRAYQRWQEAGEPEGDGIQFWLEAERELRRPTNA